MTINYFVCTLGQAARLNQTKEYKTIPEFIDYQAQHHPNLPAVGFYEVEDGPTRRIRKRVHDFQTVQRGIRNTARALRELGNLENKRQTVALLCPSSAGFLYSWLALIYFGQSALLIAPQCSASAISHLCKTTNTNTLFYHQQYEDLADKAAADARDSNDFNLTAKRLPFRTESDVFAAVRVGDSTPVVADKLDEEYVAYLHHTSGTSTGLPKPIPQTHHGGLGVLPQLDGTKHATFTTTPLYHGGVADLIRSWTSKSMIWLFPGKDLPITAANIRRCLDVAAESSSCGSTPPIAYFSSVPYVLQMMASDDTGLIYLQDMDLVGVGGAALPAEVGDRLVQNGVNLVSRFGSVECGFLMSSHRDFGDDREWQYLRLDANEDKLVLEERENGLCELVIRADWPHMARRNREDGSFATADLLEAHPNIKGAWRYHSRADAQLTLVTGKKFDPAPLEAAIAAANAYIGDVLIFGNDKPYPGVLLFRTAEAAAVSDKELISQIAPSIKKLNEDSQIHARILEDMLIPMPHDADTLEKSSKGTIMRSRAEERYSKTIEQAYEGGADHPSNPVADSEVSKAVLDIVNSVLSHDRNGATKLDEQSDLFAHGVDSIASIRIRQALQRLLPRSASKLPMTAVEDTGTTERLSNLVLDLRHGKAGKALEDPQTLMLKLVQKYATFTKTERLSSDSEDAGQEQGLNVLLTGPTGSLGSHVLHRLLQSSAVNHIYLLVRGASVHAATERVVKAFRTRELSMPSNFDSSVTVILCRLASPDLGLEMTQYMELADKVDVIAHLAWAVNFLLSLRAFTAHLDGLRNLIDFALSSPKGTIPRFLFCSTVASVSQAHKPIPEAIVSDSAAPGPTGYARSKWVAEQICLAAHRSTPLHDRISAVRVGQLSGATETGAWSNSEAYPLILSTFEHLQCLPDLDAARAKQSGNDDAAERLNWLPVDVAARAFTELVLGNQTKQRSPLKGTDSDEMSIYHLLSPPEARSRSWTDFINVVSKKTNCEIKLVPTEEWLDKLEQLRDQEAIKDHPALRLVTFWRDAYCSEIEKHNQVNGKAAHTEEPVAPAEEPTATTSAGFEMARTLKDLPALSSTPGLDEDYILKLWQWIVDKEKS